MVALQILNKILATGDLSILRDNDITRDYFVGFEDEFDFLINHNTQYGNVPDKATFIAQFNDFEFLDVQESDRYLVTTIREEYLYYKSVPVLQKAAELLKSDANAAAEYMVQALKTLQPNYSSGGTDIIANADERLAKYVERQAHQDEWFFTSGFEELDDIIHGIQREEELLVLFARTNQGKSWVLEKMCTHVWQLGFNVGYVSPEMSADSIGYRFDTLNKNFSNKALMWGKGDLEEGEYRAYIDELKSRDNKFIVATPIDFDRKITVSKLRTFAVNNKLDLIAIDGITYVNDERYRRGDSKTTTLTNISEDLMMLSMELHIPILIVVQANRGGVINEEEGTPELETIRDSDGIAHNASKVLSIRQLKNGVLEIGIKKQRFGSVGGKLQYDWDINSGTFTPIASYDDAQPREKTERKVREIRKKFTDKTEVF